MFVQCWGCWMLLWTVHSARFITDFVAGVCVHICILDIHELLLCYCEYKSNPSSSSSCLTSLNMSNFQYFSLVHTHQEMWKWVIIIHAITPEVFLCTTLWNVKCKNVSSRQFGACSCKPLHRHSLAESRTHQCPDSSLLWSVPVK